MGATFFGYASNPRQKAVEPVDNRIDEGGIKRVAHSWNDNETSIQQVRERPLCVRIRQVRPGRWPPSGASGASLDPRASAEIFAFPAAVIWPMKNRPRLPPASITAR